MKSLNALYEDVIAPCLQLTTDLAAKRGDQLAYNDIASMISLYAIVNEIADLVIQNDTHDNPELTIFNYWPELSGQSPGDAACAMILQHAELTAADAAKCIHAIQTGYDQLCEKKIIGSHRIFIHDFWETLNFQEPLKTPLKSESNAQDTGKVLLHNAAVNLISCIDIYEKTTAYPVQ